MRRKLSVNGDHNTTEVRRMAYVESCVEGEAHTHLVARLREDITNPFTNAEQMLKVLHCVYGNRNRTHCDASSFRHRYRHTLVAITPGWPELATNTGDRQHNHQFSRTDPLLQHYYHIGLFELNFWLRRRILDICCQRSVTSQSTSTR